MKPRWELPGYSEIAAAESVSGRIRVTFANGDAVEVPAAVLPHAPDLTPIVDPHEPMELQLRVGDAVETISWIQLRAATDEEFAQHMRDVDADESRRLGLRLKALREDRGMKQAELAKFVQMTAPQLSKIEKGLHDMRVSTIRALLRALGASFAEISGPDAPEVSVRSLARRLAEGGLPADVASRLLQRLPRRKVYGFLESIVGWTREALEEGRLEVAPLTTAVQFKSATSERPERSPLVHLANAVATAGRQAARVDGFDGLPPDPIAARMTFPSSASVLDLRALLTWTWRCGIPVLPMVGSGGFAAAVWDIDESPVIVLKEPRDVPAFWLFDLAHELGHIARGHVAGGSIVDVDALTSERAMHAGDAQEQEANEYALNLLVPNYRELVAEVERQSRGNYLRFKDAVASTAQRHRVNAGVLGVIAAHELTDLGEHKDRWGSSTNLSKLDGEGRAVAVEVAREFLDLNALSDEERALLETVVLGD